MHVTSCPLLKLVLVGLILCGMKDLKADTIFEFRSSEDRGANAMVQAGTSARFNTIYVRRNDAPPQSGIASPNAMKAYVRFDTTGLADWEIKEVSLGLRLDNGPSRASLRLYGINEGKLGDKPDDWRQDSITWSNAPQNNTTSSFAFKPDETTFLGTFNLSPLGDVVIGKEQLEGGASLVSFLAANRNNLVTFMFSGENHSGVATRISTAHDSADSNISPILHVRAAPAAPAAVPEPNTLIMAGAGATFLVGWRALKKTCSTIKHRLRLR